VVWIDELVGGRHGLSARLSRLVGDRRFEAHVAARQVQLDGPGRIELQAIGAVELELQHAGEGLGRRPVGGAWAEASRGSRKASRGRHNS
jgi:hypothetical protein